MVVMDDLEIDGIMFKAEDWVAKVMNQFGCEAPVDMTSVQCKHFVLKRSLNSTDKVKFAAFLSESFHLVRF